MCTYVQHRANLNFVLEALVNAVRKRERKRNEDWREINCYLPIIDNTKMFVGSTDNVYTETVQTSEVIRLKINMHLSTASINQKM